MIEYWHNPRCSKSRAGLALLEQGGAEFKIRLYLQAPPTREELSAVRTALGARTIEMMRRGEKTFKDLGLTKDSPDDVLLQAMADNPILIERPLALSGSRAVIGRPTDALLTLLHGSAPLS